MKRVALYILLLIFSLNMISAQDHVVISGMITDLDTEEPVPDHDVFVYFIDGNESVTFTTDSIGMYGDTIWLDLNSLDAIIIETLDCNNDVHSEWFSPVTSHIIADFSICTTINPPVDCDNMIEYIQNDVQVFTFTGIAFSGGIVAEADYYFWDFGDGTTGEGQTVSHAYDTSAFSVYTVCLETIHINPQFNDTCVAISCIEIIVPPQIECTNYFNYFPDDSGSYTFNGEAYIYSELVDPSYVEFYWDFGDGSFGEGETVQHQFPPVNNIYNVCLTTIISDSIVPLGCEATSCHEIVIQYQLCIANFRFELDSLNPNPNQYFFFDTSEGNHNLWYWEFGDGSTSTDQNPIHRYEQSGNFEVCLTISSNDSIMQCTDDTCSTITTPQYFDMGGFVYGGDYPLNNPANTGDTARAILYMETQQSFVPVDTLIFFELGYWWFSQKMEGEYLVKVNLTENSTNYQNWMPTYTGDQLTWNESVPFGFYEDLYNQDIRLFPTLEIDHGPGSISGNVVYNNSWFHTTNRSLKAEVLLYDQSQQPYFTYADELGGFSFNNIPLGTYYLQVDETGLYTSPVMVVLTDEVPVAENVKLNMYDNNVAGVDETENISTISFVNLFPNPVNDILNIEITLSTDDDVQLKIINMMGTEILTSVEHLSQGKNNLVLKLDDFAKGIYLFQAVSLNNNSSMTKKLVK